MITEKQIKKFETLCRGLNKLLDEISETCPEANYYLANSNFHLMKGPTHDENTNALRENSVTSVDIPGSGGGDW
jgi:hypothetical protein